MGNANWGVSYFPAYGVWKHHREIPLGEEKMPHTVVDFVNLKLRELGGGGDRT